MHDEEYNVVSISIVAIVREKKKEDQKNK